MTKTLQAIYDGKNNLLLPEQLNVPAQTRVQVHIEMPGTIKTGEPYSALKFAASLKLEGPSDLSTNMDDYLYGAGRGE
jgi:hypothetical protein